MIEKREMLFFVTFVCAQFGVILARGYITEEVSANFILLQIPKFREHFIFVNRVKSHSCHANNSRLVHDLPTSVIDSDFARILFSRNFAYTKFRKNKSLAKISEITLLCEGWKTQGWVL